MKKKIQMINTSELFLKPDPKIIVSEKTKTTAKGNAIETVLSAARVKNKVYEAKNRNPLLKAVLDSGITNKNKR